MNDNVSLLAVGDIMLGDHPSRIGHGVGSLMGKKKNFIFNNVKDRLNEADVVFGNLECVLSLQEINRNDIESLQLRAPNNAPTELKDAGFTILSLANNHILEHGREGLNETLMALSENNIEHVGIIDPETRINHRIIKVKGIRFAFLAYCFIPDTTAYRSLEHIEDIIPKIESLRDSVDVIVLSLHWGSEYVVRPSPEQVRVAHKLVDSGVDIILGHHPHVIQGVERYKKGVIAYSLGNLVADMWQEKMRESMVLCFDIDNKKNIEYTIIPVMINEKFQPTILKGDDASKLLDKITRFSSESYLKDDCSKDEMERYYKEVEDNRSSYRKDLKMYVLTNFYRYPPRLLFQLIMGKFRK